MNERTARKDCARERGVNNTNSEDVGHQSASAWTKLDDPDDGLGALFEPLADEVDREHLAPSAVRRCTTSLAEDLTDLWTGDEIPCLAEDAIVAIALLSVVA